jgi:hypothetical protein
MANRPSSKRHDYPWKVAYRAAALEPDNALLEKRIAAAQEVMMTRLIELFSTQTNRSEIRAIEKALRTLVVIKWERLGRAA